MKKTLLFTFLTSISLFASCPDLSVKSTSTDISIGFDQAFNQFPSLKVVISDIINQYNQSNSYIDYLSETNIKELGDTKIYNYLVAAKYMQEGVVEMNDDVKKAKISYEKTLKNISSKNPNWCNEIIK